MGTDGYRWVQMGTDMFLKSVPTKTRLKVFKLLYLCSNTSYKGGEKCIFYKCVQMVHVIL